MNEASDNSAEAVHKQRQFIPRRGSWDWLLTQAGLGVSFHRDLLSRGAGPFDFQ
jgi:hypothetical protein